MSMKKKFCKANERRPWDVLNCSKSHYLASAPWKRAKMKRREFEALLLEMPDGFTEYVFKEAEVERLVEAVFGKGSVKGSLE